MLTRTQSAADLPWLESSALSFISAEDFSNVTKTDFTATQLQGFTYHKAYLKQALPSRKNQSITKLTVPMCLRMYLPEEATV